MLKKNSPILLLILLLTIHVVLVSFQTKKEGTPLLKKWILNLTSPGIKTTNGAIQGLVGLWRKYFYLMGLYNENVSLKQQIQAMKLDAWKNAELVSANMRLSLLLKMKGALPFKTDGARLVIRNPSLFSETIFLDKGERDGLRIDTPVIGTEGIIGRVISPAYDVAEVQLITHPSASTGATLEPSGLQGTATGTGQEFLMLNYIKAEEKVSAGDLVLTSGMDGIYPKGLPIGKVLDVREGPSVFKIIRVKPSTNFNTMEQVLLILKSGP